MNKKEFNQFLKQRYALAIIEEEEALEKLMNAKNASEKLQASIETGKANIRQIELMKIYAMYNDVKESEAVSELKSMKIYD